MVDITTTRVNLYETTALIPVQDFAAGTYVFPVATYGNSLLSTVWVKQLDPGASVLVKWYEHSVGSGDTPGQRIDLIAHSTIISSDFSDRKIITKIHNKPQCEVIVSGGNATLGLYLSVVADSAQDGLYFDNQTFNPGSDSGAGLSVYDAIENKWYLIRSNKGVLLAEISGGYVSIDVMGVPFSFHAQKTTQLNNWTDILTKIVPDSKIWKLREVKINARMFGEFEIYKNYDLIGSGLTGSGESMPKFTWPPYLFASEGDTITISYRQTLGPVFNVSAWLHVTEEDKPS